MCYRQSKDKYIQKNYNKFETKSIKSSLCDYSDVINLVTRDITVTADINTDVPIKNCASFFTRKAKINVCLLMKQTIFTLQFLRTI